MRMASPYDDGERCNYARTAPMHHSPTHQIDNGRLDAALGRAGRPVANGRSPRRRGTFALVLAVCLVGLGVNCAASTGLRTTPTTPTRIPATASAPVSVATPPTVARPSADVDELVTVDGAKLHVRCVGSGATTVVLIAGFGDAGDNWSAIEAPLADHARVCSYAHFGTGTSDPPPAVQTFTSRAAQLRSVLRDLGDDGPFVVAGHSYGGAEAVAFASMFPDEVNGLILLDASPVTWPAAGCAVTDDGSDAARTFRESCTNDARPDGNPELLDIPAGFAQVATISSLGALPMAVVTAADHPFPGLDPAAAARLNEVWNMGQRTWARLSSAARPVSVADTSHYIQLDQPAIVIDEIEQLLGVAPASPATSTAPPSAQVQAILDQWTSTGPGKVTAALRRAGGEVISYTSGTTATGGRVGVDDQFRIGSITKTFVAVMTLQAVDEGRIDLDAPVARYLPGLTIVDGVTVRQLLDHTSGIPDINSDEFSAQILSDMDHNWTPNELLAVAADQPREFQPGHGSAYSNTNYVLVALVLEAVTGRSLADNLRIRITGPLGMHDTYLAPEAGRTPIPGFSPYLPGGTTTGAPYTAIETAARLEGGIVSTTHDLVTFITSITDGRLLSAQMLDTMTPDTTTGFGVGITSFDTPAGPALGMHGAITGYDCLVGVIVDSGDLFVILSNDDGRSINDLADQVIDAWA